MLQRRGTGWSTAGCGPRARPQFSPAWTRSASGRSRSLRVRSRGHPRTPLPSRHRARPRVLRRRAGGPGAARRAHAGAARQLSPRSVHPSPRGVRAAPASGRRDRRGSSPSRGRQPCLGRRTAPTAVVGRAAGTGARPPSATGQRERQRAGAPAHRTDRRRAADPRRRARHHRRHPHRGRRPAVATVAAEQSCGAPPTPAPLEDRRSRWCTASAGRPADRRVSAGGPPASRSPGPRSASAPTG